MSLSFGCFLLCFILSLFLTVYLYFILHHSSMLFEKSIKYILIGLLIVFVRMAIPLNFPFTHTIFSYEFLPSIMKIVTLTIPNTTLQLIDVLYVSWIIVAISKLILLFVNHTKTMHYLSCFDVRYDKNFTYIYKLAEEYFRKPINISVVPDNISPCIIGFKNPILVLPNADEYTKDELRYICIHEMNHLNNYHLWMTLLIEIVCCVHWWNPIVYYVRDEYALFLEITNDTFLIKNQTRSESLKYVSLLIRISKRIEKTKKIYFSESLCFITDHHSAIKTRVSFIVNGTNGKIKNNAVTHILHYAIILCAVLVALFIVPEASSYTPGVVIDDGMSLEDNNAYFIKCDDSYSLYLQGNFMATLSPNDIPDDLKDLPIYEEGDLPYEKQKNN